MRALKSLLWPVLLIATFACRNDAPAPPASTNPPQAAQATPSQIPPPARGAAWRVVSTDVAPAGSSPRQSPKEPAAPRRAIAVTPASRFVADVQSATPGRESTIDRLTLRAYDAQSDAIVREMTVDGELVNLFGIAWAPDGSALALCEGNRVSLVDWTAARQTLYAGPGGLYPGACTDLTWSADGARITFVQLEHASDRSLANPSRITLTLEHGPAGSSLPEKGP